MENNEEMTVPAKKAKGPDTEKKKPGFYLTRPSDWPRLDIPFIKSKCGMLNDTEFKLVILTCKTGKDAVKTVNILRTNDAECFVKNLFKDSLTEEQIKNNDNLYLIIRKLAMRIVVLEESLKSPCVEVSCNRCEEPEPEQEEDGQVDSIKSEEEIEQEAEDYKEYEEAYDENAQNNARPSVKKSERYK